MVKHWKGNASFGTIGIELVLCIMVGLFGGRWLDAKLGTAPWLSVIGFFFGLAAGGKAVWRGYKDMQIVTAREEREQGNPAPRYTKDERPEADDPPFESRGEGDDPNGAPPADSSAGDTAAHSREKDDRRS
jgi:ATP synthase protein I